MHQILSFKCIFLNHFVFTFECYLFLLFLVKFRDEHWELHKSRSLLGEGFGYRLWMRRLVMEDCCLSIGVRSGKVNGGVMG